MREKHFYLEFKIGSQARFDALHRFFAALKSEKDRIITLPGSDAEQAQYDPVTDPKWLHFLDEEAIEWFTNIFDYNSEEGKTYQELWRLTAPEVRLSHPMFRPPGNWDFESMIGSLFNGEYALVDLVQESAAKGILFYDPWAAPFGGSEALVALVESFGHAVTFDSWHRGPHRRQWAGWDYKLAKQLVSEGKGFVM